VDRWILDQAIDLMLLCDRLHWERDRCVDALEAHGVEVADAEAFVAFAIAERANPNSGAEQRLSFRQWARLRIP
jgi:hypothetical protein